uniref:Uncharacterized protein n=1 Tax=Timema genevievae TaxID=629358 RepID=A0A7R9JTP8_TIMGE|nr:unnamed protein product [Timema genevievae]
MFSAMDCWQASSWRVCSAWVFLLILDLKVDVSHSSSQAEVNKHLEMGRDFLSRGQLQDALSHYHAAVGELYNFSCVHRVLLLDHNTLLWLNGQRMRPSLTPAAHTQTHTRPVDDGEIVEFACAQAHFSLVLYHRAIQEFACAQAHFSLVLYHRASQEPSHARPMLGVILHSVHLDISIITSIDTIKLPVVLIIRCFSLEGDPDNYLTHFKRATVYLALGKSKFALKDLDRVLQLKPDFTAVSTTLKTSVQTRYYEG